MNTALWVVASYFSIGLLLCLWELYERPAFNDRRPFGPIHWVVGITAWPFAYWHAIQKERGDQAEL